MPETSCAAIDLAFSVVPSSVFKICLLSGGGNGFITPCFVENLLTEVATFKPVSGQWDVLRNRRGEQAPCGMAGDPGVAAASAGV